MLDFLQRKMNSLLWSVLKYDRDHRVDLFTPYRHFLASLSLYNSCVRVHLEL